MNRSIDPAMVVFRFRSQNDSLAAVKTASLSTPQAIALSKPRSFGTRAEYRIPFARSIPAKTSAASANCGTHFGLTKLEVSISGNPASERASTRRILSATGTMAASFWSPSRGPTSVTST